MRRRVIHRASRVRPSKSPAVRAGLVRTFGGLAGFVVVSFRCCSLYILDDAFANPLDAGAVAVISAAFIIALAAMLLFFLIKPQKRSRPARLDRSVDSAPSPRCGESSSPLPTRRFYVDHSRIRP